MSDADFGKILPEVARSVFEAEGMALNAKMSGQDELRYGSKGSISVDLPKGTWFDHEEQRGGGTFDLLAAFYGYDKGQAIGWLEERGFIASREQDDGRQAGSNRNHQPAEPVAVYDYHSVDGQLLYQVCKYPKEAGGPRFRQRRPAPNEGHFVWGLSEGRYGRAFTGEWFKWKEGKKYEEVREFAEVDRQLYRLPELQEALATNSAILLLEGEKDVDTARRMGYAATCPTGGANKWVDTYTETLRGAHIVAIPDNDKAGRNTLQRIGRETRGIVASYRTLDLRTDWPDMPEKADLTDWDEAKKPATDRLGWLIENKALPWQPEPPETAFGALTWADLDRPGQILNFRVDRLIIERGTSVIAGPSGSGKTFAALDLGVSVARGVKFLDFQTVQGGVLYQAGEGGLGVKQRLIAYRKHHEMKTEEAPPFVPFTSKVDLFSKDGDTRKFIDECRSWRDWLDRDLAMVFIDTLAKASIGADENNGKDMGYVLEHIHEIEQALTCNVCLVHHLNAAGTKLRGHSSIFANVDTVIEIMRDDDTKVRTLKVAKQKDGEDGIEAKFELKSIKVGYDERFERDRTSCAVVQVGAREELERQKKARGYEPRPKEREILANLFGAAEQYGRFIGPQDEPQEARGRIVVEWSSFLTYSVSQNVTEADEAASREALKKSFERNSKYMRERGIIKVLRVGKKGWIWWDGKPVLGFSQTFPKVSAEPADQPLTEQQAQDMQDLLDSSGGLAF